MAKWTLSDIIDLEAQLAWDRVESHRLGGESAGLDQRDRVIGQQLTGVHEHRGELLHAWVGVMRERGDFLPGLRVQHSIRLMQAIGMVLAVLFGIALAVGVLAYDGSRPVSILAALGILVVVPFVLWLATALLQLPGCNRLFASSGGPLQWLVTQMFAPLLQRVLPKRAHAAAFQAALLANLSRRHDGRLIYAPISRSLLTSTLHCMGLLAVCAACVTVLMQVLVSDIAFAWGSTLRVDVEWMQELVAVFSAPWAWAWPEAVPDERLISISQYSQLDDRFIIHDASSSRAVDAAALGDWWRFLLASMLSWAVLPRLALWLWCHRRQQVLYGAQSQRSLQLLDHREQIERLQDQGPRFRSGPGDRQPDPIAVSTETLATQDPQALGDVIIWDECHDHAELAAALPGSVRIQEAGHDVDARVDRAVIAGIDPAAAGAIMVLVAGDEQPLAELLAFLRDVGHAAGQRACQLGLLGADGTNRTRWQEAMRGQTFTVQDWTLS